jgi:hypothetical protein
VSDQAIRMVIWVPIVHSQEDMGRLREAVRRHHVERNGEKCWEEHVRAVAEVWDGIRRRVLGSGLDLRSVRLYQDGLPVCGREAAIVADLAEAGSENHRLLADLIAGGAALEGTESPELLLREYELALKMLGTPGARASFGTWPEFDGLGRELLDLRDRFIAGQIDRTLKPGETGIVFLGMLHALPRFLPSDVCVERLDVGRHGALRRVEPN